MDAPPVQYVRTSDGYDIAYTVCGEGQPYVLMPNPGNHVQLGWQMPFRTGWFSGLGERFRLICYDSRGQGMSTRGLPADFSLSDLSHDLETVIDHLKLEHFVLDASIYYGHVAIQYALAYPDRVKALVLKHCSLSATLATPVQRDLARESWDHFLLMVSGLLPGEGRSRIVEYLHQAISQQDWLRMADNIDVSEIGPLLRGLRTPTLLLHERGFTAVPYEEAPRLAAQIAGSRLVITEGSSFEVDPAQGLAAIEAFVADLPPGPPQGFVESEAGALPDGLSSRELEVLRLLAQGKSNPQIAEALFITRNTVQNHVSSILIKTNLGNRAQAAVYAKEHGIV
jgi:DNA-binding CsgD family transcriptional regulator/pimeloyl-ACP methyl ester carboxylesterase